MNQWTLLRLSANLQTRFLEHVQEQYPDAKLYFPTFTRLTRPARKRHTIQQTVPVYPGYIFTGADSIGRVKSTIRFHYIRFGGKIALVPDSVIQELKRLESINQLVVSKQMINPYSPGTRILIHTPAYDLKAIVIQCSKNNLLADTPLGTISVPLFRVRLL